MGTPENMETPEGITPETDSQEENEWEKKYKELQADYTRKSQELSEIKKQSQTSGEDEEVKNYLESFLQERGYVSKEELEQEKKFSSLIDANPELKPYAKAIKTLANKEGRAYEDVIEEYGFSSKDKLSKAKERSILGDKAKDSKKNVRDMSDKEWEEFTNKQKKNSSKFESVGTL